MYADYPNSGLPSAPLKVNQKEIIQTTIDYMNANYPDWNEKGFRKCLKIDV